MGGYVKKKQQITKEKVLSTFRKRTYFKKYSLLDYSDVVSNNSPILCECPEHGEYTTRYSSIDRSSYCGCKKCAKENARKKSVKTCLEKYGVSDYSKTSEWREKTQDTFQDKYKTEWVPIKANKLPKEELLKRIQDMLNRNQNISVVDFGELSNGKSSICEFYCSKHDKHIKCSVSIATDNFSPCKECGHDLVVEFNKEHREELTEKSKKTNLAKYGSEWGLCSGTTVREKVYDTNMEKYGSLSPASSETVINKIKETNRSRYGVEFPLQSKEIHSKTVTEESIKHGLDTKRRNKTFNSSKPEELLYNKLISMFSVDDIKRQYCSELYPFNCDFYITSLDLYIEYNGSWLHGGHFFSPSKKEDLDKLNLWKNKNTKFYRKAIETWTVRDVNKLNTATKSEINYLVLWKLEDVDNIENLIAKFQ